MTQQTMSTVGKVRNIKLTTQNLKLISMFKNYFKTAWRNLMKNKGFSFINITGLAIGMAAAILILLWIQNEMSRDTQYPKSDRLYLMFNRDKFSGELWAWSSTPMIMGPTIKQNYPDVEDAVRVSSDAD